MREMTMRQRLLAVLQGRPIDRVPFVQYSGLAGPNEEIWAALGRGNMGLIRWSAAHRAEQPNCRIESEEFERDGRRGVRRTLHSPEGRLTDERFYEPAYGTTAAATHFIKEPADYRTFLSYLRDITIHEDLTAFRHDWDELGDDGLPMVAVGRTAYQALWVEWTGLEDLCLHLVDEPALMEEVTDALAGVQRQVFRAARSAVDKAPIPYVDFADNITAPVIGERYFRKYCLPLYQELSAMLAEKDVPTFCHMDGDLKPLWAAIGESGLRGLDSFSPAPDNDTSVADAVRLWPEMRLFMNYPSSVHLWPPEKIYAQTMEILRQGGATGRLSIQISENVPPGRWKESFPPIVRAIRDFGPGD